MLKGIVAGVWLSIAAGLIGTYAFISLGGMPANADSEPSRLEEWAARKSLRAAVGRQAPKGDNPVALDDDNLLRRTGLLHAHRHVHAPGEVHSHPHRHHDH